MRTYPLLILASLNLACATAQRPPGAELAFDVERVVKAQEQLGWSIDRIERDAASEDLLASLCRATPKERAAAHALIKRNVSQLGASASERWRRGERPLALLRPQLTTERTLSLLDHGLKMVEAGACPFWWETTDPFVARQQPLPGAFVSLETSGRGYAQLEGDKFGAGGGGASRLVLGGRVAPDWGLFTTLEFGGGGRFDSIGLNQPIDVPDLLIMPAVLIQLRRQIGTWYVFAESGPMTFFTKEESELRWGARTIIGGGAVRLRIGPGMPFLGAQLGVDWIEPGASGEPIWQVFAGGNAGYIIAF